MRHVVERFIEAEGVGAAIRNTRASILRMAACKGDQVALESAGHGLFTRTLIDIGTHGEPGLSYRDVLYRASKRIGVYQEPTLDHYDPEIERFVEDAAFSP